MICLHLTKNISRICVQPTSAGPPWQCSACKTLTNPWLCLICGEICCGRYVNGHGISHWKEREGHCLVLDCESMAVFCYECDDYVNEDTEEYDIKGLRGLLSQLERPIVEDASSESSSRSSGFTKSDIDELRECHSYAKSPLDAPELVSVCESYIDDEFGIKRALRPRKRSVSNSSSVENQEKKTKKEGSTRRSSRTSKAVDRKKAVGLRNLGNTCFMNAVLQSLSNIKEFCFYFKQLPALQKPKVTNGSRSYSTRHSKSSPVDDSLMSEELRKIIISLNHSDGKGAISPESLFNVIWEVVPRFRGYQQQDAHEFLRYMLDRLHTELLNLLPDIPEPLTFLKDEDCSGSQRSNDKSSIVTAIFGGTLLSEVRCLCCGMDSGKNDPFLDLSLDIPSQFYASKKVKDDPTRRDCRLTDCLLNFMEVEELGETELYMCSSCRSKQRSTKKFSLRRLPNVLCLHLKRFRWTNYLRTKIDVQIEFPLTGLDMSRYVPPDIRQNSPCDSVDSNLFDLAAVVVHHGSGTGSGHYTAFASHDGNWYHFNDSTVKLTDEETVAKCKAYILFYVRREFQIP